MSSHRKKSPKPGSSSRPLPIPSRLGLLSSLSSLPDNNDTDTGKPTPKITKKSFKEIARVFEECIQVKDRRYRLKTYKKCFIGADAVTLLYEILQQVDELDETEHDASFSHHSDDHVMTARVEFHQYTRRHACALGRALAEKFNLFTHVTNDHLLMDDYYMYRFTPKGKRLNRRGPTGRHSYTSRQSSASLGSIGSDGDDGEGDDGEEGENSEIFEKPTEVLTKGDDNDHDDAEETKHYLEQLLAGTIALDVDSHSVVYDEIAAMGLMTESIRFFGSSSLRPGSIRSKVSPKMEPPSSRRQKASIFSSTSSGIGGGSTHSTGSWISAASSSSLSAPFDFSPMSKRKKLKARVASITNVHEHLAKYDIDLLQVANEFEMGVQVGTNRYHGKSYKQTFVGNDAVDFIIRSRYATSRQDAVIIGNALMTEFNLFQHVSKQHDFKE